MLKLQECLEDKLDSPTGRSYAPSVVKDHNPLLVVQMFA